MAKDDPEKNKKVSLRAIITGTIAGAATGFAVSRHPFGAIAGALVGSTAAAMGITSGAFNKSAGTKEENAAPGATNTPQSPAGKAATGAPTSSKKGDPWHGRKRDMKASDDQEQPTAPDNKNNGTKGNGNTGPKL